MNKNAAIIEKAVVYLEKELERGLGMQVKTEYHSPTNVILGLDDRVIKVSDSIGGHKGTYNLILGLKEAKKMSDEGEPYYLFPMRLIDVLVAKISYDNKVRKGETK